MPNTQLQETIFTVVTLGDQWIIPETLADRSGISSSEFAALLTKREVIKLSAVRFTPSDNLATYQAFIKPSQPLSEVTKAMEEVTESDFDHAISLTEALQGLVAFCQGTVLVCHNAVYTIGLLSENLQACGLPALDEPMLDTQQLARRLHPGWHRASSSKVLAKHYRLPVDDLSYANRITALFRVICQDLQVTRGLTTVADLQDFMTQNEITKSLLY